MCGDLHADDAARAAAVLDHDRLAEVVGQRLAEHARDAVDRAARRERHDQPDRPFRKIRANGARQQRGGGREGAP